MAAVNDPLGLFQSQESDDPLGLFAESGIEVEEESAPSGIGGLLSNVWTGTKQTGRMIGAAGNTTTGDLTDVEGYAAASKESALTNTPVEQKRLQQEIAGIDREQGALGQIGDTLSAAGRNKMGTAQMVVEQAPNSVVALGGGWAGAKAGAIAGGALGSVVPVVGTAAGAAAGGVLGFLGGMFLGNTILETGGKALEKAEGGFTEAERGEALREGAVKGGVITAVDAATLGVGGKVASTLGRAATKAGARAEAKVLMDAGVDMTSPAAINAALAADKALLTAAKKAGESAAQTALSMGRKATIAGTGLAMETVGEGAGEYLGELAATGEGDVVDATIEALSSFSQSAVETGYNYNKAAGNNLSAKGMLEAAPRVNLDPIIQDVAGIANMPSVVDSIDGADLLDEINASQYGAVVETPPPRAIVETPGPHGIVETVPPRAIVETPPARAIVETAQGAPNGTASPAPAEVVAQGGESGGNLAAESLPDAVLSGSGLGLDTAAKNIAPGSGANLAAGTAEGGGGAVATQPVTASWVIREKGTGKVVMETFDKKKVAALNTEKYEAVPIREHLAGLSTPAATATPPATEATSPVIARVGATPNSTKPVTVKAGVVHLGDSQAQNFETGADITVPEGATFAQVKQALQDAGAVSSKQKVYPGVIGSKAPQAGKPVKAAKPKPSPFATKDPQEYAQAARDSLLKLLRKHGLSSSDARDLTGENAFKANQQSAGIFKGKTTLDKIVIPALVSEGYMTQQQVDEDPQGGMGDAMDLIRSAFSGEFVGTFDQQERMAELEQLAADAEAELQGEQEQAIFNELIGQDLTQDEFDTLFSGVPVDEASDQRIADFLKDQENDAVKNAAVEAQAQEADARGAEAGTQGGEGANGPQGIQAEGRPGLDLAGQTPAEVAAADKATKQAAADKADADAKAEARAKADRERDSFTLSGSDRAADANAGQGDLLAAPTPDKESQPAPSMAAMESFYFMERERAMRTYHELSDKNKDAYRNAYYAGYEGKPLPKSAINSRAVDDGYALGRRVGEQDRSGIGEDESGNRIAVESTVAPKESKPSKLDTAAASIDTALDAALKELADALKKQNSSLNSGVDPAILALGVKVGALYVAKGVVKFAQYSKAIIDALRAHGVSAEQIKPYLKQFYAATKQAVDDATFERMDDDRTVRGFDLDSLDAKKEADKPPNIIPESDIKAGTRIADPETAASPKPKTVSAREAMRAANQNVKKYEALRKCLG